MFIINNNLYKNINNLKEYLDFTLNLNSLNDKQLENLLKSIEKTRYYLMLDTKLYNKNSLLDYEKIKTLDDEYDAKYENDVLKIYIPELIPSFKNLKTHTYKRILANVSMITKPYENLFDNQVFILIKVLDKIQGWDIDNKYVKPISDALVMSKVIQDDNITKMFYCVKGEFSEKPHTEVYVFDVNKKTVFENLIVRKNVLDETFHTS